MKTIETIAVVQADGTLTVRVPPEIRPGEHRIVLVIEDEPADSTRRLPHSFPVDDWGAELENLSLRREDLYDDRGL